MSPRRIIIGDVHGHYGGLVQLLDVIAPGADDRVYFLGDLIDRGPQSSEVIDFVCQSGYSCIRGNHEQLFLDAFPNQQLSMQGLQSWLYNGGYATYDSYGGDVNRLLMHLRWVESLPLYLDLGDVWLVHAGVNPKLSIAEQTSDEFCWVREEFHSIPEPYFPNKLMVIGHTITLTIPGVEPGQLAQGQGWIDIDTGAYHPRSGWLTGFDVDNHEVYQINMNSQEIRQLPLAEIAVQIEPERMGSRRQWVAQVLAD